MILKFWPPGPRKRPLNLSSLKIRPVDFISDYIFEISGFHWSIWAIDCLSYLENFQLSKFVSSLRSWILKIWNWKCQIKPIFSKDIIRPSLVIFFSFLKKNYNNKIKCKLSKSQIKWTGLLSHSTKIWLCSILRWTGLIRNCYLRLQSAIK